MAEWFKCDFTAPEDPKLVKLRIQCGYEGIGVWWSVLAIVGRTDTMMWPESDLAELANILRLSEAKTGKFMKKFIELSLMICENGFYSSPGFIKRTQDIQTIRLKQKEGGKAGGLKSAQLRRFSQGQPQGHLKVTLTPTSSLTSRSPQGWGQGNLKDGEENLIIKEINNKEKLSNGNPNSQNFQNPESQNLKAETSQIQKKIKTEVRVPKTTKSIADLMPIPKKPIETDHPNDNPFEDVRDDDQIFD
jgi:hypothetical protein